MIEVNFFEDWVSGFIVLPFFFEGPSSRCASAIQNRTALLDRTQKMTKGPVGCGGPLSQRDFVGGAEMDSLVDTDTDDITSRIGKAIICLRCVGNRARHQESRLIPEEMLRVLRHGPCYIVAPDV